MTELRTDFIDYPTGWKLQKEIGTDSPPHHPECSAHTTGGIFLCDCNAIKRHWIGDHGGDPDEYQLDPANDGPAVEG